MPSGFASMMARMQKRVFWLSFTLISLVADLALPLVWGILATVAALALSWWLAYRSGWF